MERKDAIQRQVVGFLVPIFYDENGLSGLGPSDFHKVRTGYACAKCLAEFNTYTARCPLCGLQRDLARDIEEAPQLWVDHLKQHFSDDPGEKPEVINPFSGQPLPPDYKLPEMETVPLKKLMKSKWGRGR